jgi:phytoene synthase
MSVYTTSFFLVSRFLPRRKRQRVEVIYAAVRYPDEVVDSFPLTRTEREERLDCWAEGYEKGLTAATLREAMEAGVSPFLAAFTRTVKQAGIPHEHYRSFLAAMLRDIRPMPFQTLEDLINSYIYGSAIVVGYFLAYVYGAATHGLFDQTLESSRNLAIGLQLTNFLRDIKGDQRRGRLYLPLDMIRAAGARPDDFDEPGNRQKILGVVRELANIANGYYQKSNDQLNAFAPDCRVAIKACIEVYRKLNGRIATSADCIAQRESVPTREKWNALPTSKYWLLPWAMIRR